MHDSFPPLATTVTGSGPALLLAHGATGSIEGNFGPVLPALAATHTVIAPDYPGSGRTPVAAAPLDLDALADSVVDSAVRRGAGRFAVLGFSLGTLVAVRAAVRHPERVTALVLTAGFARPDDHILGLLPGWRAEAPPALRPHIDLIPTLDTTGDLSDVTVWSSRQPLTAWSCPRGPVSWQPGYRARATRRSTATTWSWSNGRGSG